MSEQRLDPIIEKYLQAYNHFDIDGLLFLLDDNIQFHTLVNGKVATEARGKKEFEHLARLSSMPFSSRNLKVTSVSISGSTTSVGVRYTGILARDIDQGPQRGEVLQLRGTSHFTVENDLITTLVDES